MVWWPGATGCGWAGPGTTLAKDAARSDSGWSEPGPGSSSQGTQVPLPSSTLMRKRPTACSSASTVLSGEPSSREPKTASRNWADSSRSLRSTRSAMPSAALPRSCG